MTSQLSTDIHSDKILILDFGAQYTQLIARRIREQRVYSEIHPCTLSIERMRALQPMAIVLSGGPQSVYEPGAPTVDPGVFELGVPVLADLHGPELEEIGRGALLHDIGKIGVPDSILLKPGKLDPDEWEVMKRHPAYAVELLSPIDFLRPALSIPLYHHEKWDGSGYPHGLKGPEIPIEARIFSVVDVFDALTSKRPYRDAWHPNEAKSYIEEQSDCHFDPAVVGSFLEMRAMQG